MTKILYSIHLIIYIVKYQLKIDIESKNQNIHDIYLINVYFNKYIIAHINKIKYKTQNPINSKVLT